MKTGIATFTLMAGLLVAFPGADLRAESAVEKEERKGLLITNDSGDPWKVAVDGQADMNGEIEILQLNRDGSAYSRKGKLKKGKELDIPVDGKVLLSPVPPRKWLGAVKSGVDFSAQMHLLDAYRGRLAFTMTRASGGDTANKTCHISFGSDFQANRLEQVLLLTPPESGQAGQYVSPLHITAQRLPPPPARTKSGPGAK